ncbi:MAG: RNA methyltransferase, partial [Chloroflexota bacterium]|nr:RNA methyltransferase [Chloroflexota bacterium]
YMAMGRVCAKLILYEVKIRMLITSPNNPRISKLRELYTPRGRKKTGLFLMEGIHLLDTVLNANMQPQTVYYAPELLQRTSAGQQLQNRLLTLLDLADKQLIEVSERVLDALGDVQTSQGVISVLSVDTFNPARLRTQRPPKNRPVLLILDGLSDPGNMGTILRTALAADVESVLLTPHCVDYYNPKVVRAAAGAHIALPIETHVSWPTIVERVEVHCSNPRRVFLAEAGSSSIYYEEDLKNPYALIIGNEAQGSSLEARSLATSTISIPLANNVESLNAAMATGIILYEAVRQSHS